LQIQVSVQIETIQPIGPQVQSELKDASNMEDLILLLLLSIQMLGRGLFLAVLILEIHGKKLTLHL